MTPRHHPRPSRHAQQVIADAVIDVFVARLIDDLAPLVDERQACAIAARQVDDALRAGWTLVAIPPCPQHPKDRR